jgi:hypothetical protein
MKLFMTTLILSALVAVSATSVAAPARSARSACTPKPVTVKGHPGVIECGPAKAVVRFKGKTLRYKGGTCKRQAGALFLYIGTHVTGGSSDHLFYLYMQLKPVKTYTPSTGLVGIQLGYASYHWKTGSLTVTAGATSGTFKGTFVKFPETKTSGAFSGSYTC